MTSPRTIQDDAVALLRALTSRPAAQEPEANALGVLADAILRVTSSTSIEIWLEGIDGASRWRFPGGCPESTPSRLLSGDEGIAERVARALSPALLLGESAARTPAGSIWAPDEVLVPFKVAEGAEGALRLTRASLRPFELADLDSLEAIAGAVGSTLANRRTHAALVERVKELTCVYRIAQVAAGSGSLAEALERIVGLLPPAWQHPDATTARIRVGDQVCQSPEFREGPHSLRAPIFSGGETVGWVEVFHGAAQASAPFLPEEQHLIDAVARELSSLVERKTAQADRAKLRDQLRHADRLATIGQLAAGVAHEINEPLASVLGFAQLAVKAPELSDSTRGDIERIVKASLHAREIIRNLLVFSRQSPSRRVDVDVEEALRQAVSLAEPRCAAAAVTLTMQLTGSLPSIQGDPSQLQQVFLNLLVNAIQSMPDGGQLDVSTATSDEQVTVQIQDTGEGIDPEDVEQIFLPFFTTKDVGEGTGLGLSVVHGIVTAHNGAVNVSTKPGHGTCFEVVLPVTAPSSGGGG